MSSTAAVPKLFQPIKVGGRMYAHRVVMAPLTRYRANKAHVHGDLAVEYYGQRSTVPGTLIITEATSIAAKAGGYRNVPGIWSDEQVVAWKRVTDAVHGNGSRIFCQLWAPGRAADPEVLEEEDPSFSFVAPSDIPMTGSPKAPRPLTISEIKEYIKLYTTAAKNAIRAGFDGVELHGANGYLVDQFLQDVSNKRIDEYGGSIENRSRFALEIIDSVTNVIGEEKMGIRLSPWGEVQDMRMSDPKPTFSYLVSQIAAQYPNFAYIHVIEPRVNGNEDRVPEAGESNDFLRTIWAPRRFISSGGHNRETAFETAEKNGDLVAFGRFFISHPDLPLRLAQNLPISKGDRDTYYTKEDPHGYIDYPFANDTRIKL
ncbi:NADH:flavin oxidoreductase/NADH oxidase [Laetiporus sulphureus 93-53]|uniref:NADH:flavin oxidoreductase/NADH oxidase n=1 Tax=Laetiporus sulphureus 93-53 TaxID=1314785 RepID=A0A165CGN9_9APHY|nr:NADH:flavin oxidoreductase/NADH oxidase [Laetiporus sulphureus 93-53]KZT02773.1 NADH:flavin oxidoreductase/NADH oxidase [Laetiporus sulphureus 93-53]